MTCCVLWTFLLLTLSGQFVSAQQAVEQTAPAEADSGVQFDLEALSKAPEVFPTEIAAAEGVKSFFYAGLPYKGKPTRIFAYYGVPEPPAGAEQRGVRVPCPGARRHRHPQRILRPAPGQLAVGSK